ncbi:DUF4870 domain-containing protein [Brevibacillus dissolubilis]|uniref:DUF4870 domain-containing protein n=1 Tax=Brevibacillus dissolubilis TaxID=1844116 RepID=UPI0021001DF8|nr:DUF4870 domain-containing protein [Brevibacillus dissolubilis]
MKEEDIVPLIIWLIKREQSEFVASHAKESLNFNITIFLITAVGYVLAFLLVIPAVMMETVWGYGMFPVLVAASLALSIFCIV